MFLALDPDTLALPESREHPSIHLYVYSLLQWSVIAQSAWGRLLLCRDWEAAASDDGRYPIYSAIRDALETAQVRDYDAATVSSLITRLIRQTTTVEKIIGVDDVLWESCDWILTNTKPQTHLNLALDKTGILLALGKESTFSDVELGSSKAANLSAVELLAGNVMVQYCDPRGEEMVGELRGIIKIVNSAGDYVASLDPAELLADGTIDIAVAVRIAVFQRKETADLRLLGNNGCTLGREFAASVRQHRFGDDPAIYGRIIRACADTILGTNLAAVHPLRRGRGAEDPQQTRGTALAWRRDVDYEYHLHYWQTPGESPEFAAVVVHEDFNIP
jgi:hypothetical protein